MALSADFLTAGRTRWHYCLMIIVPGVNVLTRAGCNDDMPFTPRSGYRGATVMAELVCKSRCIQYPILQGEILGRMVSGKH